MRITLLKHHLSIEMCIIYPYLKKTTFENICIYFINILSLVARRNTIVTISTVSHHYTYGMLALPHLRPHLCPFCDQSSLSLSARKVDLRSRGWGAGDSMNSVQQGSKRDHCYENITFSGDFVPWQKILCVKIKSKMKDIFFLIVQIILN